MKPPFFKPPYLETTRGGELGKMTPNGFTVSAADYWQPYGPTCLLKIKKLVVLPVLEQSPAIKFKQSTLTAEHSRLVDRVCGQ